MGIEVHNASHLRDGELGPTAVALGNFDGVHMAHRVLCESLVKKARDLGVPPVVYTFQPHPRKVLSGPHAVRLLCDFEKKCALLGELGVEIVVWSEFTREFSEQSASDFITKLLVGKLSIQHIFVGYDSHFAHNREGNFNSLVEMGKHFHFGVDRTEAVLLDGLIVSSSQIREYLDQGEIRKANRFLGWQYAIAGTEVRGEARGRVIGFPTANLQTEAEVVPARGVYATQTLVGAKPYWSVTNIGKNPTFNPEMDGSPLRLETHLLDFSGDLYGRRIEVAFLERIRGEMRFEGPDLLKAQIEEDVRQARTILARS